MAGALLHIESWRIHVLAIGLKAPVRWAGHSESQIEVVLLDLRTSNGARGVSEMTVRPKWHGETTAGLVEALNERLLPQLRDVDLHDQIAYIHTLSGETQSALARALADMAREDILAQVANLPLQDNMMRSAPFASARDRPAPASARFSCTITRSDPQAMAQEAEYLQRTIGASAFKIKTGQGYATDAAALDAIRRAVGNEPFLSADSNSAGPPEITGQMAEMLASHDVGWFEDPCRLQPDASFTVIAKASAVPVLVDNACRSLLAAKTFLSLGARGLSIKIMKTGISESLAIAHAAAERRAQVTMGICASTSLSAIYSLALFAGLPPELQAMPCEETFFINVADDIMRNPLIFEDGALILPAAGTLADQIDWTKVEQLSISQFQSD